MSLISSSTSNVSLRSWAKNSHHPIAKLIRRLRLLIVSLNVPVIPVVHAALYRGHLFLTNSFHWAFQFFYWSPLFRSRLSNRPSRLSLYSGMPQVAGNLQIEIGDGCRVSGKSSLFGRTSGSEQPMLRVGNNVDIGWETTIAVGTQVILEDNVRMAGKVFLAGFPGHPLDPVARAAGKPETDDQVGDIVLEKNVWLATGVSVMAGVRIGRNTIVAAGSVVTKDLPENVVAAGCPARVVRKL